MGNGTRLLFNPFVLDTPNQSLERGREKIVFRLKAFPVLDFLVRNPHRLVTKTEIRRPQYLMPGSMSLTSLSCQSNVVECQDNNNFSKQYSKT
jgi:hypothetical protein